MRWSWFRRPATSGRHARPLYPSVPGAAATLVAVAAEAGAALESPPPPVVVAPPTAPAADATPVDTSPRSPLVAPGSVGLGFSDGGAVELDADDPAAAHLRALAEEILGAQRA